ncbi:MAG: acyltransferase [Gemmatimonas sp.]|nr:acyltransferase [Gemmatimonas sp.]
MASLVVIVHNTSWISGPANRPLVKVFTAAAASGWVGVQLFFVLSGFLITGIIIDTRDVQGRLRRFFVRRALRIFPPYFLLLILSFLVVVPLTRGSQWAQAAAHYQWTYWLYLSNWTEPYGLGVRGLGHLWSLAIEEQFYLLWPLLAYRMRSRQLRAILWMMVLSGPLVRYGLHWASFPELSLYSFTVARWDALAVGALLAIDARNPVSLLWLQRWNGAVATCCLVALLALGIIQRGFHAQELPIQLLGQSLTAIVSGCVIVTVVHAGQANWLRKSFSADWLVHVGKYSYAMYLFHVPVHTVLSPVLSPWIQSSHDEWQLPKLLAYCLLVSVAAYGAARVSWLIVEEPSQHLKHRLTG